MTKQESIEATQHQGKFEGSAAYTAYFYDLIMDGGGDDEIGDCSTVGRIDTMFEVDKGDIATFPELLNVQCVVITETDTGFVSACECTLSEWESFVEEQTEADEEEIDE